MKKNLAILSSLVLIILASPCLAKVVALDCRVQYKKEGELAHRSVALSYDDKSNQLKSVNIDEQAVHSFNINGKTIYTSVDSERIQIEFVANTIAWRSNFRDRDYGAGLCVKL